MSTTGDNIHITDAQDENVQEFGREHNEKLQQMARSVVSGLYMLVRSVKMYETDNNVFDKPLRRGRGRRYRLLRACAGGETAEQQSELAGDKDGQQ